MAVAERHSEDDVMPALPTPGPCCLFARETINLTLVRQCLISTRAHCIPQQGAVSVRETINTQPAPSDCQYIICHPPGTGSSSVISAARCFFCLRNNQYPTCAKRLSSTGHRFVSDFLSNVLFLSEKQSIPNLRQAIVIQGFMDSAELEVGRAGRGGGQCFWQTPYGIFNTPAYLALSF